MSDDDMKPLATTIVTISIDCLSDNRVGIGVVTRGGNVSPLGVAVLDALLDTVQNFLSVNGFPVNVRRPFQ